MNNYNAYEGLGAKHLVVNDAVKIIYSLQVGKNKDRNGEFCGYRNAQELLDSLLLSALVSRKHFSNIEFYTDTEGYNLIRDDGRQFPFTNIIICFDELNWLKNENWAFSKVYVYSLQTEPFIHLDIDAFLWDGIPDELLEKKMLFQQQEPLDIFKFYADAYDEAKGYNLLPNGITYLPTTAINTAVFGVLDMKYLQMIQEYYSLALEYVKGNSKYIHKLFHSFHQCILFEQLFLVNILDKYDFQYERDYETILNSHSKEKHPGCRYTHLIVSSKRNSDNVIRIRKRLESMYNDYRNSDRNKKHSITYRNKNIYITL